MISLDKNMLGEVVLFNGYIPIIVLLLEGIALREKRFIVKGDIEVK